MPMQKAYATMFENRWKYRPKEERITDMKKYLEDCFEDYSLAKLLDKWKDYEFLLIQAEKCATYIARHTDFHFDCINNSQYDVGEISKTE